MFGTFSVEQGTGLKTVNAVVSRTIKETTTDSNLLYRNGNVLNKGKQVTKTLITKPKRQMKKKTRKNQKSPRQPFRQNSHTLSHILECLNLASQIGDEIFSNAFTDVP